LASAWEESIAGRMRIGNRQSAIGNDLAVAEGFEPSHGRINSAVPYQLGYATRDKGEKGNGRMGKGKSRTFSSPIRLFPSSPSGFDLEATKGVEPLSSGLQDRRSVFQLSYVAIRNWWTGRESNPHKKFAGLLCCRLHHQPPRFVIGHLRFVICHFQSSRHFKAIRPGTK
jgi:hypothetical protein